MNSDTFYMVVELKGDNDDTDDVYQGDIGDIETDEDGRTAVFVLTVDDDSDETPLAEMVLVIVPDEDSSSSGGGSSSSSDDTDDVSNGDATLTVEIGDIELTAESVRISSTGNLSYTFGVDTDAEQITYDWAVYIDGTRVDRGSDVLADVIDGEVDGTVSDLAYDEGDEVEIIISDVKVVDETEEPEEETYTLTLSGSGLTADSIAVYEGNVKVTGSEMLSGTEYEITEGAVVTITGVTVTAGTYVVDGVTITATSDRLTFTMSGDFTLDSVPGSDAAVYTVTIGEGITLTDANGNEIESGDSVAAGTVLTVDSTTDRYLVKNSSETGYAGTSYVNDTVTMTVNDSLRVYAAVEVTLGTGVEASYIGTTGNEANINSSSKYVAVGTELTLTVDSTNGSAVIEGTGSVATEALGTTYTVGESDVTLTAAWTVVLGEGVTASIDSTTRTAGTYYVANSTGITSITAASGGTDVVELNSRGYADNDTVPSTITADVTLAVATKVTFDGDEIASFTYMIDGETSTSISVGDDNVTLYFVEGTVLNVVGDATGTAGENITVNSSDVENGVASTTYEGATGSFTVGDTAITVSQG